MTDFLDIISSKLELSPKESGVAELWFRRIERDNLFTNAISSSGGGGYVTSLEAGNVSIDLADGITLRNPDTGARTVYLDPDGDAWFGSNIDLSGKTSLSIFSNDQTYNTEAMGKGDLLLGDNSANKANLFWDNSTGTLRLRVGQTDSIVLGDGGIIATWGQIGGWDIDSERIYKPGIELNSTDETIKVGSGDPHILIDGANKNIRSSNFSSGAAGFQIDAEDGSAEFNNITARGTFGASVFEAGVKTGVGGWLVVSKNAAEVWLDVTTPGGASSFSLRLKDDHNDNPIAESGDVININSWNGTEIVDVWVTVTGRSGQTGYTIYTVDLEIGENKDLQKGMAAINYGPSGTGVVELEAGATKTRIRIRSHSGNPWSGWSTKIIIGNMRGTYGTGANDNYGIGMGDYSGGNYLSYNAEVAGEFLLKAGGGAVAINADGIRLSSGSDSDAPEETDVSWDNLGFIGGYGGVGEDASLIVDQWATENYAAKVQLRAWTRDGPILPTLYSSVLSLYADYGAAGLKTYGHFSGGPFVITPAAADTPARGVAGDLVVWGDTILDGDIYNVPWTDYKDDSSITGWSSFTTKVIEYKRAGNLVFCNYRLAGPGNATSVSFTLPDAARSASRFVHKPGRTKDNNVWGTGVAYGRTSGSLVVFGKQEASGTSGTWSSGTGTRVLEGSFFYEIA